MNEDFCPDFALEDIYGLVVTPKSILKSFKHFLVASVYNRLVFYDIHTKESVLVVSDNKRSEISAFDVKFCQNEIKILIGYENGVLKVFNCNLIESNYCDKCVEYLENLESNAQLQIKCSTDLLKENFVDPESRLQSQKRKVIQTNIQTLTLKEGCEDFTKCRFDTLDFHSTDILVSNQYRAHSKAVVGCYFHQNLAISAGLEGTLIAFDIYKEEIASFFSGNTAKIFTILVSNQRIIAACSDKTVKIWHTDSEDLQDIFGFSLEVSDLVLYENFLIVFQEDGQSEIINIDSKIRKPFNIFKKLKYAKIFDNNLFILTKDKLYGYEIVLKTVYQAKKDSSAVEFDLDSDLVSKKTIKTQNVPSDSHNKYDITQNTYEIKTVPVLEQKDGHIIFNSNKKKTSDLTLKDSFNMETKQDFIDFTQGPGGTIFLQSKNNQIDTVSIKDLSTKNFYSYHSSEIINLFKIHQYVISVSNEAAIVWNIHKKLNRIRKILFSEEILSADILQGYLVANTPNKILFYNVQTGENVFDFVLPTKKICASEDILSCVENNGVNIYKLIKKKSPLADDSPSYHECLLENREIEEKNSNGPILSRSLVTNSYKITYELVGISQIEIEHPISCIRLSSTRKTLGVGILSNNNINVYDIESKDLKFTLYGHSLPVKTILFSPDETTMLSASADKLVKLWGMDFGECRKSFIGNTNGLCYINENLFLFADQSLKYYKKHELIKTFKQKYLKSVWFFDNCLFATSKHGIFHYEVLDLELIPYENDDSSEMEEEILSEQKIVSAGKYEYFKSVLEDMEKIETGSSSSLIKTVVRLDLSELDRFCYFLTDNQVTMLFKCAYDLRDISIVVSSRMVNAILKFHGHLFENDSNLYHQYNEIVLLLGEYKNRIGNEIFYHRIFTK